MKYELVIKPEAEKDLSETFEWYEERRKGLGYDFLLQVDASLRFIEKSPLAFHKRYKGTRRHIIKAISLFHNLSCRGFESYCIGSYIRWS